MADQSNTDAEGAAAFKTLVNFLGRCQEDYFRLVNLAFPLSELELFYSLKEDSAFVDFAPLKVYERTEIFTRYRMRLLPSNLPS